jgi:hypothetical protein
LVIVRKESTLIDLVPNFLSGVSGTRTISVDGFAVVENQR